MRITSKLTRPMREVVRFEVSRQPPQVVCGSTVYWQGQGFPGMIGVAIGAFADPTFPPPTISVWEETRHSWVELQLAVPATRHG
jgi:hypothetical protein